MGKLTSEARNAVPAGAGTTHRRLMQNNVGGDHGERAAHCTTSNVRRDGFAARPRRFRG